MVAGEQSVQLPTLGQELTAAAGQGLMGPPANTPLRIINTSPQERRAFNLFVLDDTKVNPDTGASASEVDASFKRSFQAGDLDATMDLFAPETVEISPLGVFPGKDAIRKSVDTFIKANPGFQATFSESQTIANTAVHRVSVTSEAIRTSGISHVMLVHTLVVNRGKIIALAQQLDLSDPETAKYSIGLAPQGR
jgi:ketosteroid isomerase-like protein